MRAAILADGGPNVGLGHFGRCMAIAQAMRKFHRVSPVFVTREPSCKKWVRERGFKTISSEKGEWDLLITDSYRLSRGQWEKLRRSARRLAMINDGAPVPVRCDWVLNSSVLAKKISYARSRSAGWLLGPRFHPLRKEYWSLNAHPPAARPVRDLLLMLGGNNGGPLMAKVVRLLRRAVPLARLHVVVGPFSDANIGRRDSKIQIHRSPANLLPLLRRCQLAVSAGGQTLYELAAVGVPTIAILLVDNQKYNVAGFEKAGAMISAGRPQNAQFEKRLVHLLKDLSADAGKRREMAERGRAIIDPLGAKRTARAILSNASVN